MTLITGRAGFGQSMQRALQTGNTELVTSVRRYDIPGAGRWRSRSFKQPFWSIVNVPVPAGNGENILLGQTEGVTGFVQELAADGIDVTVTCRVLNVSRSGYYAVGSAAQTRTFWPVMSRTAVFGEPDPRYPRRVART